MCAIYRYPPISCAFISSLSRGREIVSYDRCRTFVSSLLKFAGETLSILTILRYTPIQRDNRNISYLAFYSFIHVKLPLYLGNVHAYVCRYENRTYTSRIFILIELHYRYITRSCVFLLFSTSSNYLLLDVFLHLLGDTHVSYSIVRFCIAWNEDVAKRYIHSSSNRPQAYRATWLTRVICKILFLFKSTYCSH